MLSKSRKLEKKKKHSKSAEKPHEQVKHFTLRGKWPDKRRVDLVLDPIIVLETMEL